MKREYDFSKGKRGPVIRQRGKTRITIHLDDEVLEVFRERADWAEAARPSVGELRRLGARARTGSTPAITKFAVSSRNTRRLPLPNHTFTAGYSNPWPGLSGYSFCSSSPDIR
jgi:hypothetical protein